METEVHTKTHESNSMVVDSNVSDTSLDKHMDKSQQIKMWQQNHYMSDSGIHSATGTHTPSISSRYGPDDGDGDDRYLGQKPYTFNQWSAALPHPMNVADSCLLSPATPSTGSVLGVDSLTDTPGGSHTASNVDLRGNKLPELDTDEAASAIPELVKLIKDEDDQVIIYQSSMMVFQLSKSEAIDALIKSTDMIECIISALDRTDDPETVRFLSGTLYNMSQTQMGLKAIFAANCVRCLVKLLNSPIESVLFYAITTLHNLLLHQDGAKVVVRQSGCLQKMTALLQKNNIKFLTICTDCLQILAYGHQESKLQILASGGPVELVRILRSYQYEKLLWTTARVLKVLSVCTTNKPAIISAGGMDALAKHLHSSSHRLVLNCLWALRNLSDAATRLDNLQPLLHSLVRLLDCNDNNLIACSAGILSNLTCNNHSNKLLVYKLGGVHGLLRAVTQVGIKEDILEPCMCALRHLTSRHEDEETARNIIVHELNGLPVIARILHAATAGICPDLGLICQPPQNPVTSWMLIKALVGLLRNLSVNLDSHYGMRECGLVTGLFLLLYATQYEISKRAASASSANPTLSTIVQSVRLEEIVEGICGALHMLAKDYATRSYLALLKAPNLVISPNVQPGGPGLAGFVQLLYSPHESIQRAAAGLLAEVSQDRDGLDVLAMLPGASARFEQLAQSCNEAISTYASAVVIRLGEERKDTGIEAQCIFSSPVDTLNTPPSFSMMESVGPYQSPIGSTALGSQTAPSGWSHQFPSGPMVQEYQSMAISPPHPNPHPNSLTAMLGPPPSYKGCTGYCNYWSELGPPPAGSFDSNCGYSDMCDPSAYCGGVPPAVGYSPNSRTMHRMDVTQSNYLAPVPMNETTAYLAAPVNHPLSNTIPSDSTTNRRSGFGSLNTSGYISPSNEVYMHHQSPPHVYKPSPYSSVGCSVRSSKMHLSPYNPASCCAPLASPTLQPSDPQPQTSTNYLSPELMSLDEPNSEWLPAPTNNNTRAAF